MESARASDRKQTKCRKAAVIFAGVLLVSGPGFLSLAATTNAQESSKTRSESPGPMATEDAAEAALKKRKLEQEIKQLESQNASSLTNFLTHFATPVSIFVPLLLAVGGYYRWAREQWREREKRDEDRFQAVVSGLGSAEDGTKVGAAIMLRTFIEKKYSRFFEQAFNLAVANLRVRLIDVEPRDPSALHLALITVFRKVYPDARANWLEEKGEKYRPQDLHQTFDASYINLDKAFLWRAELPDVFMPHASLRDTDLTEANLARAQIWSADLWKAKLRLANLEKADLGDSTLIEADLSDANLSGAYLWAARLAKAKLWGANLSGARLRGTTPKSEAHLEGADLCKANLKGADLRGAKLVGANLRGADFEGADLRGADLNGAEYNSQEIRGVDEEGKELIISPTHWQPQPDLAAAVDVSTKGS